MSRGSGAIKTERRYALVSWKTIIFFFSFLDDANGIVRARHPAAIQMDYRYTISRTIIHHYNEKENKKKKRFLLSAITRTCRRYAYVPQDGPIYFWPVAEIARRTWLTVIVAYDRHIVENRYIYRASLPRLPGSNVWLGSRPASQTYFSVGCYLGGILGKELFQNTFRAMENVFEGVSSTDTRVYF